MLGDFSNSSLHFRSRGQLWRRVMKKDEHGSKSSNRHFESSRNKLPSVPDYDDKVEVKETSNNGDAVTSSHQTLYFHVILESEDLWEVLIVVPLKDARSLYLANSTIKKVVINLRKV